MMQVGSFSQNIQVVQIIIEGKLAGIACLIQTVLQLYPFLFVLFKILDNRFLVGERLLCKIGCPKQMIQHLFPCLAVGKIHLHENIIHG